MNTIQNITLPHTMYHIAHYSSSAPHFSFTLIITHRMVPCIHIVTGCYTHTHFTLLVVYEVSSATSSPLPPPLSPIIAIQSFLCWWPSLSLVDHWASDYNQYYRQPWHSQLWYQMKSSTSSYGPAQYPRHHP